MNKKGWLILVTSALVFPVFAGDGQKCTADAQTCINYMAEKFAGKGWLGVELDHGHSGVLEINRVVPNSPAEKAGIKAGDILVAVEGIRYDADQEAQSEVYKKVKPGREVTYLIGSKSGTEREVKVTLAEMPDDVKAKWIGYHILESHCEMAAVN